MNRFMSFHGRQTVVKPALRSLLSDAARIETSYFPGRPVSSGHLRSRVNSDEYFTRLSTSQSSCVWRKFKTNNSTYSQIPNDKGANLTVNSLANFTYKFPEQNRYLSKWNSLINCTGEKLFGCKLNILLPLLKPPLVPWGQCVRDYHGTARSLCSRNLPIIPYEAPKDSLGLTYISDLGEEDAERVKSVAYEELKQLLTTNNIQFTKVKAKKRTTDHGVFGTSLEALVHKDIKNRLSGEIKVPAVFLMMIRFIEAKGLDTEGIFRLSGSSDRVKNLRKELEIFYKKPSYNLFDIDGMTVHEWTAVFKAFFRELPALLVSSERMEFFPDISNLQMKDQIRASNLFILSMKEEHRDTLQVFLRLMSEIIKRKSANKMDDTNLATCLTPNIFAMPKLSNPQMEMSKLQEQFGYFKIFTHYYKKLFVVSPDFLSQVRQQYISGASAKPKRKFISKLLGKKKKEAEDMPPPREELMKLKEVEIEVHPADSKRDSSLIKVTAATTAQDVLKSRILIELTDDTVKPEKKSFLDEDSVEYLYEVGGNIGERCLDPATKMLDLYRVNPTAEWAVKSRKGR
ncbi:Rho GTPase-activating protein 18 [Bulinus truncatus]|nr:Rho GTPase-activating protein 18 [Bulinus truncatus]